jgi:deoxyribodipyrimidine photolyase-related protein
MNSVSIIFPHQLFEKNPCLRKGNKVYLVEEYLFFNQYKFHKQKLVFHRASMRFYEEFLLTQSFDVEYIDAQNPVSDIRKLIPKLRNEGISEIYYTDVVDDWVEKCLQKSAADNNIKLTDFNRYDLIACKSRNESYPENYGFIESDFIYPISEVLIG